MVIALCCIGIPTGNLIAFIWTGFAFAGESPKDSALVFETLSKELFGMNILCTAIAVPLIFIIRDKPENPPSKVATKAPVAK
jgi:hypothetical protein